MKNEQNLTPKQREQLIKLKDTSLKTARAYKIKLALQDFWTYPAILADISTIGTAGLFVHNLNPSKRSLVPLRDIRMASFDGFKRKSQMAFLKALTVSFKHQNVKQGAIEQPKTSSAWFTQRLIS
ncbi:transposase [Caldalkalibacillus thermarum TA2.A1]|uniref:Transposase n=1 Tax=Caldalkalibacillus thermarum (strain TA2.A1) TaxID=986075 RepID=A0A8X8LBP5_CALTT|nr:transposase [Caldalkalibacillus thermarum TA2.A1]